VIEVEERVDSQQKRKALFNVKPIVGELAYIYGLLIATPMSAIYPLWHLEREQFMVYTMVRFRTMHSKCKGHGSVRWHDTPHQQAAATGDAPLLGNAVTETSGTFSSEGVKA
jgi:hypothetical protein